MITYALMTISHATKLDIHFSCQANVNLEHLSRFLREVVVGPPSRLPYSKLHVEKAAST